MGSFWSHNGLSTGFKSPTDVRPLDLTARCAAVFAALASLHVAEIVSANVGCIQHLQAGTATPVRHWVEVLDDALRGVPL